MSVRRVLSLVLWGGIAGALLVGSWSGPTWAQEAQSQPTTRPGTVAPLHAVMYWVDRSFRQVKLAATQKRKERGARYAWLLAELSNVNTRHSGNRTYQNWAREVSTLAAQVAGAFKAEDFDKAKALAKQIAQRCTACHDQFRDEEDEHKDHGGG